MPGDGGLDPERGVDLTYFVDKKGFAKQDLPMPGEGPTWMTTLVPLRDREDEGEGKERLYASYIKVKASLTMYARPGCLERRQSRQFEKLVDFGHEGSVLPAGARIRSRGPRIHLLRPSAIR